MTSVRFEHITTSLHSTKKIKYGTYGTEGSTFLGGQQYFGFLRTKAIK